MWKPDPRGLRDFVTFALGALTFAHQVVVAASPQPLLVGASLVLMGVPGRPVTVAWLIGGTAGTIAATLFLRAIGAA